MTMHAHSTRSMHKRPAPRQACCRCGSIEVVHGWWTSPDIGDIGGDGLDLVYTLCPTCSTTLDCSRAPLNGWVRPTELGTGRR